MRIALVSTPFVPVPPRAYGGTELVVGELARGLEAAGHDVTLIATGDSEGSDVRSLYERAVWPPDPYVELLHARYAARVVARESFDLVHAHVAPYLAFADELRTPVVYTLHHARDESLLRLYRERPLATYVAISARQARLVPELHCHIVHHGLDPRAHPAGRGEGDYALFIGRLSWCKGPDIAVEAARRAGVELVVAGELHEEPGNPNGWTETVLQLLDVPGVRRVGSVGGDRKRRLIAGARAVLMPIRWEEPFGLVMIEAMLSGTPVLAFPRGAAPEIIEDGVTGFLVEDADDMAEALRRVESLDRGACRRRARERFSTSRMVGDYLRVYRTALVETLPAYPAGEEWSYAG